MSATSFATLAELHEIRVRAEWNSQDLLCGTDLNGDKAPSRLYNFLYSQWENVTRPVYIPVKDMLAHSVGFLSLYDQRYIDFDATHHDILSLYCLAALSRETAKSRSRRVRLNAAIRASSEG